MYAGVVKDRHPPQTQRHKLVGRLIQIFYMDLSEVMHLPPLCVIATTLAGLYIDIFHLKAS